MICRRGGKSLYVLIVQYVMSDATGLFIKTELRFYGVLSREIGVNQRVQTFTLLGLNNASIFTLFSGAYVL